MAGSRYSSGAPLSAYFAETDPGVSDDDTQGYAGGSRWYNQIGKSLWECLDSATGAAVWLQISAPVPPPPAFPSGAIVMWSGTLSAIPVGWNLCDGTGGTPDLRSSFVKGAAAGIDPGVTGGSDTHTHDAHDYTPAGAVSQPTFSGNALAPHSHGVGTYVNSAVSAGTPAGTVSQPTFTGNSVSTSSDSAGTPSGTVSQPTFTGNSVSTSSVSGGTPSGNVAWPVGVPTIAWPVGVPTAANESSHTHSVTSNVSVADHVAHTHSVTSNVAVANHVFTQPTVAWPVGVPTITGIAVADHASHTHSVTSNVSGIITPGGTVAWPAGVPTHSGTTINAVATVTASKAGTSAGAFSTIGGAAPGSSFTPTINSQGTIAWPAVGVPIFSGTASQAVTMTNNAVTSAGPNATLTHTVSSQGTVAWPGGVPTASGGDVDAHAVTNNAVTSGNPSATLTHAVTNNAVTSGAGSAHTHTISWPVGVPANAWPAGVPTFAGDDLTGHAHTVTPTGTVSQPTFSGSALSGHAHTVTATGAVSQPTFTGSALGTHTHTISGNSESVTAGTPSGTVSQPDFTGDAVSLTHNYANNEPVYFSVAFIMKA